MIPVPDKIPIIQTRFRDVDFDEIFSEDHPPTVSNARECWAALRGKPVAIEVPGRLGDYDDRCSGPFYRITPAEYRDGGRIVVCAHIVEIGD